MLYSVLLLKALESSAIRRSILTSIFQYLPVWVCLWCKVVCVFFFLLQFTILMCFVF